MAVTTEAVVKKDLSSKKITVTRQYDFTPQEVWDGWTKSEILDQWWAPKPWRAETKSYDFTVGGTWVYAMVGPNNERHWGRLDYNRIEPLKSFDATDAFADEYGVKSKDQPETNWRVTFNKDAGGTKLVIEITASTREALEKMLEMGFEEGFKMALDNLEEYLQGK